MVNVFFLYESFVNLKCEILNMYCFIYKFIIGCMQIKLEMFVFYKQVNFVCDDLFKIFYVQMIFYFGVLVGDVGFGSFVDVYVDFIIYCMICYK